MNDFFNARDVLKVGDKDYVIYRLDSLEKAGLTNLKLLPFSIRVLLEAALLSVAGGLVGVTIGGLAALGVRGLLDFPAQVTPGIVVLGIVLAAGVGLAAGYWPARNASNLAVVDALRDES